MEKIFRLKDFQELLEIKDTLLGAGDSEEFFYDVFDKLETETNIFEEFDEDHILNRITEILVYISPNALLEFDIAIVAKMIECDNFTFENLLHAFSQCLVRTSVYHDTDASNVEHITSDLSIEEIQLLLDSDKDKSGEHFVQYFYDNNDSYN